MKKSFFPLSLLFACVMGTAAQASESAWVLDRDTSYVEMQAGYGRFTDGNLPVQQLNLRVHSEIGFLETATLLLDFPFLTRSQERVGQDPVYLTNNGFTDLFVGSRVRVFEEPFALSLRGGFGIPTGYDVSSLPVIGDRQLNIELGAVAGTDFDPFEAYVQGGLSYRLRSDYDDAHAVVLLAKQQGQTVSKPADQLLGFVESGLWLTDQLFASLTFSGEFGLPQNQAWVQSQLLVSPLLAWRAHPMLDISLQLDQALWSQNMPFITQGLLGLHFRYGVPQNRPKGLRGMRPLDAEL
ncbi:MAG: hypothetical protein ACO1RX_19130 [Candidatus Sericytochromatia bacterium]